MHSTKLSVAYWILKLHHTSVCHECTRLRLEHGLNKVEMEWLKHGQAKPTSLRASLCFTAATDFFFLCNKIYLCNQFLAWFPLKLSFEIEQSFQKLSSLTMKVAYAKLKTKHFFFPLWQVPMQFLLFGSIENNFSCFFWGDKFCQVLMIKFIVTKPNVNEECCHISGQSEMMEK